jgi:HlyD family secretion protein
MLKLPSLLTKPNADGQSSTRLNAPETSRNGAAHAENGVPPSRTAKGKSRRKRFPKKTLGALALLLLVGWLAVRRARSGETARPEVKTAIVERGDVRATISSTGKLQPFTTVDVKSKAGGTVLRMAVEEGTRVRRGQLICLIDPQDTTAALRQAEADVDAARAALRQAQQNARLQSASIGPQIRQSAESVTTARARLKQSRETLSLESSTLGPAIEQSTQEVAAARARLQQSQQALALQRRTSEAAIVEARSGIAAAQARLVQAQAQARTQPALTRSAVNQAQASVAASQANVRSAQESLRLLQSATQPQERASAQAQVDEANSNVETAQTNLTRQEALLTRGFVAQNVVETARNQLVTAQSGLRTAQARVDTLQEQQAAQVRDQQARIEQATGALNQARAGLESARTNGVQDSLRQQDVAAARATLQQAQSTYSSAVDNRRQVALKQADVASAQAALRQAQAGLTSTRANSRQINVRAADVESAQAAVRQAQAALQGAQANTITGAVRGEDVARAQAQLARAEVTAQNARTNLQQTRVVAPRDGVVLKKYVDEGTIIQSGQSGAAGGTSIIQLANVSRVYVDVQVDEADIALIEPGQDVSIALDAYPNTPKTGKVRKVFPEAEELQNVTYIHVQVEVDPMDVDERLRPNMNATCDFLVEKKQNALKVPTEAVKDDEDNATVTVIKDPKKPLWEATNQQKRTVEVGVRGDESTEVISGIKLGETVVTQVIEPVTEEAAPGGGRGGRGGASVLGGGPGGGRGMRGR